MCLHIGFSRGRFSGLPPCCQNAPQLLWKAIDIFDDRLAVRVNQE